MNKERLYTKSQKLANNFVYLLSVYDLEPSGILVVATNNMDSKERILPVSEKELAAGGYTRSESHLDFLLSTIILQPVGKDYVLASTDPTISKIRKSPTGDEVELLIKEENGAAPGQSIHQLLVTGLAELCRVKPVGLDAVQFLGEWLLLNNPSQPAVMTPDDEEQ